MMMNTEETIEFVPDLIRVLKDVGEADDVRLNVAQKLAKIHPITDQICSALIAVMESKNSSTFLSNRIAHFLTQIGPRFKIGIPQLIKTIRRIASLETVRDKFIIDYCAHALASMGHEIIPDLLRIIKDKATYVRMTGAFALGYMVIQDYFDFEDKPHSSTKQDTCGITDYIEKIGMKEELVSALINLLEDENSEVRRGAIFSLSCIGLVDERIVPLFVRTLNDKVDAVRLEVLSELESIRTNEVKECVRRYKMNNQKKCEDILKEVKTTKGCRACLENFDCSTAKQFLERDWFKFPTEKIDKKKSEPGNFETEIEDTGERAAQRAYFLAEKTNLGESIIIRWLDLEIPICLGNAPRRNCIDLRGMTSDKHPVIVEMKFAKTETSLSDSPLYALFEGLFYCATAYSNRRDLKKLVHRNAPQQARRAIYSLFPHLIVAANTKYWQGWHRRLENQSFQNLFTLAEKIQKTLPYGTWIKFASFPDIDFNKQQEKQGGGKYCPSISESENRWEELTVKTYSKLLSK